MPSFPTSYAPLVSAIALPCFPPFLPPLYFLLFGNLGAFLSKADASSTAWIILRNDESWKPSSLPISFWNQKYPRLRGMPHVSRLAMQGQHQGFAAAWGQLFDQMKIPVIPVGTQRFGVPEGAPGKGQQGLGTKLVAICFPFSPSHPHPTSGSWTSG